MGASLRVEEKRFPTESISTETKTPLGAPTMSQRIEAMRTSLMRKTIIKPTHEHDETVNPNPTEPQRVIKLAAQDLAQGQVDTGRSDAVDVTYKKLKRITP
jgi:hypothetical protein